MWYVDRTRYEMGFTCPWRRLLNFHALLTGLSPKTPALPLTTGILVHKALETFLKKGGSGQPVVSDAITEALSGWDSDQKKAGTPTQLDRFTLDLVEALTHGYARVVYPTLLEQFEILHIEKEFTLDLSMEAPFPLTWMARPDLVCRNRTTKVVSIHDFKTAAYWRDTYLKEWGDSLQLMMNAHVTSIYLGEPVPHYYVHFLVKGSPDYPTPLTHAWLRPSSPPFEPEDWQLRKPYRKGGLPYQRVVVSEHRSLPDWVWSLPSDVISKMFILGGPFFVSPHKVNLFLSGLFANEWWWKESLVNYVQASGGHWDLNDPTIRAILDRTFPRTFNCYTYNSRCSFYDLCFKPETKWEDGYVKRTPHHTTEVVDEG